MFERRQVNHDGYKYKTHKVVSSSLESMENKKADWYGCRGTISKNGDFETLKEWSFMNYHTETDDYYVWKWFL